MLIPILNKKHEKYTHFLLTESLTDDAVDEIVYDWEPTIKTVDGSTTCTIQAHYTVNEKLSYCLLNSGLITFGFEDMTIYSIVYGSLHASTNESSNTYFTMDLVKAE